MDTIYLDNNATTRPADEVIEAVHAAMREQWANPSSLHRPGQRVRQAMDLARESVATLIGARNEEIILTSGGTEAANLALQGSMLRQRNRSKIITARIEHSAVRETAEALARRGMDLTWLSNDRNGMLDVDQLRDLLRAHADIVAIVSILWVNNETGVIQPIEAIGEVCRDAGVLLHVDGTQMVGKLPVDVRHMPVDMLSFAAHKFHGPKGVGGLFVRQGVKLEPILIGGPQERQRRGGTENVAGVIGLGVAADLARNWLATDAYHERAAWRDEFEQAVGARVEAAVVNARDVERIWTTSNIGFPGAEAEAMLLMFSERGLCASAGAACSSGSLDPSAVLAAMEVPPEIAIGSVRFSFSRETTRGELQAAVAIVGEVHDRLRELSIS